MAPGDGGRSGNPGPHGTTRHRVCILAPRQASRVRPIDGNEWQDVSGGNIYPAIGLPGVAAVWARYELFFYDGPIAQALAFEGLLDNGEAFANRLLSAFADDSPRLVHIATMAKAMGTIIATATWP